MGTIIFEEFFNGKKYKIFVDMDSVLTDLIKQFKKFSGKDINELRDKNNQPAIWKVINRAGEEFWSEMDWMPDGKELWNTIKHLNPIICSTPARSNVSKTGKQKWCKRELGEDIKVILTNDKELHAKPKHILIDDRKKNIEEWKKAGGIGVHHLNTNDTLKQLKEILK